MRPVTERSRSRMFRLALYGIGIAFHFIVWGGCDLKRRLNSATGVLTLRATIVAV